MIRTGNQYLASIRDGREVYINGGRVKGARCGGPALRDLRFELSGQVGVAQNDRAVLK